MDISRKSDGVTLLGVKGGPAIRPGSSMPTSILVNLGGRSFLVDAGLGAASAVCRAGVALADLEAAIITHLHSDHYLELGPLLHTAWTSGLKSPIPVYGPSGIEDYWQGFVDSMRFDIDLRMEDEGRPDFTSLFPLSPIDHDSRIAVGDIAITAMRNHHPPIAHSYALRIKSADFTVVLSGDTAPIDEMVEFARGADLLVHEAMLTEGIRALCDRMGYKDDRLYRHIIGSHTSAEDAGRIACEAEVGALALNHFVPEGLPGYGEDEWLAAAKTFFKGPIHIGRDGMAIPLGK
ncbi:MAG: MBL fold metallo-hydrolase [Roseovarius sp.]|nr:MBL fold metallo-hydrolase [Roseovarius sp.]